MELEFLLIIPVATVMLTLVASNVVVVFLKIFRHGKEARAFARFLEPYLFMLRLGGRESPHGSKRGV